MPKPIRKLAAIVFTDIVGFIDLKKMIISLGIDERDHGDDGWVSD